MTVITPGAHVQHTGSLAASKTITVPACNTTTNKCVLSLLWNTRSSSALLQTVVVVAGPARPIILFVWSSTGIAEHQASKPLTADARKSRTCQDHMTGALLCTAMISVNNATCAHCKRTSIACIAVPMHHRVLLRQGRWRCRQSHSHSSHTVNRGQLSF